MKIKLDDTHTLKGDTYCCWLTEKRGALQKIGQLVGTMPS